MSTPVNMIIFCPRCGVQHIDTPESEADFAIRLEAWRVTSEGQSPSRWTNPPHKSHLCHACKHVWRHCEEVETNGVQTIKTAGEIDSAPPIRRQLRLVRPPIPNLTVKLFHARVETPITTADELMLVSAMKAILWAHGDKGSISYAMKEFRMNRFAFEDAIRHQVGNVMIATDGNNGQDIVRLIENVS
jgi:hypothetical protein